MGMVLVNPDCKPVEQLKNYAMRDIWNHIKSSNNGFCKYVHEPLEFVGISKFDEDQIYTVGFACRHPFKKYKCHPLFSEDFPYIGIYVTVSYEDVYLFHNTIAVFGEGFIVTDTEINGSLDMGVPFEDGDMYQLMTDDSFFILEENVKGVT